LCSTESTDGTTGKISIDRSSRTLLADLRGMGLDDMYNDAPPFASP